jgi:hypothetical protein
MPLSVPSDWQGQPGTTRYMRWRELYNSTIGTAELGSGDSSVRTGGARGRKQPTLPDNRIQRCCNSWRQLCPAPPRCPPTAAQLHPCAASAPEAPDLQPFQYRSAAEGPACSPASQSGKRPATHPPPPAGGQEDAAGGAGSLSMLRSRPGGMGAGMQPPLTSQLPPGAVAELPAADRKSNSPLPRGFPTRQLDRAAAPAPPGPGWRPHTDAGRST